MLVSCWFRAGFALVGAGLVRPQHTKHHHGDTTATKKVLIRIFGWLCLSNFLNEQAHITCTQPRTIHACMCHWIGAIATPPPALRSPLLSFFPIAVDAVSKNATRIKETSDGMLLGPLGRHVIGRWIACQPS